MGWMQRSLRAHQTTTHVGIAVPQFTKDTFEPSTIFIDDREDPKSYKPLPLSAENDDLPYIPSHLVFESVNCALYWLVIENIVYDCTEFIREHPGGPEVLKPFWGSDCTWQFHRFHGKDELEKHGRALRIGRTQGVSNKFKERPRFIGLRRLGGDN